MLAVGGVDFTVAPGSTVTLLGPSGCGKTTTLRCIAGLEVPTGGRITVGDTVVYDGSAGTFVEPERRNIGMVFQSYAIWPHMTVGGNVGFPLRIAGRGKAETEERTRRILDMVGLGELHDRSASAMSGGQQQRVALARALVHEPSVVLFDEPLSNLDANLRERMRTELQLLQSRLGFTAIFVTHDQQEALSLSDHIIVMNKGRIEQEGSPKDVFQNPQTPFTARFLGYANSFPGQVSEVLADGSVRLDAGNGHVACARWRSAEPARKGDAGVFAFRADRLDVLAPGTLAAGDNVFAGTIEAAAFLGTFIDYTINAGGMQIKAEGKVELPFVRGDAVQVRVQSELC
ncbi:MAG: ABC transporter ATP-binding protein, partial [Rhizobiales bacterium]|nr:ABC transporter ATP-binding protein [Hyphomicrobiales bacterium]